MEMTETQMFLAISVLAPVVILGTIGMVRGYHLHLKIWKGKDDNGDH